MVHVKFEVAEQYIPLWENSDARYIIIMGGRGAGLFEAQGKEGGDENKYILARVIVAGLKKGNKDSGHVLFAEELSGEMSDYFKEAHRGPYKGKWFREGLYELLFDHQVRYNDISNEIARGLEWAAKQLFKHTDVQTIQNIRVALKNGDLIKSADIEQIQVRLQGFDQLVADREYVVRDADRIANSAEVVQGGDLPADTPFRLGLLMDVNASKLYSFLRKKVAICYREVFSDFLLKEQVKDLKGKDIIRLTGDPGYMDRFRHVVAEGWFGKLLKSHKALKTKSTPTPPAPKQDDKSELTPEQFREHAPGGDDTDDASPLAGRHASLGHREPVQALISCVIERQPSRPLEVLPRPTATTPSAPSARMPRFNSRRTRGPSSSARSSSTHSRTP